MVEFGEDNFKIMKDLVEASGTVEYIKLLKNTKGYNWEIKIFSLNTDDVKRVNDEMINKFGEQL